MNNLRVLIIESETTWQEKLKSPLHLLGGSEIDVAGYYEAAVHYVKRKQYDLIVVNLSLLCYENDEQTDVKWGWEILGILRELTRNNRNNNSLAILVITGNGKATQVRTALNEYQVHDFIEMESFDTRSFMECVSTAILKTRVNLAAAREQNSYCLNISFNENFLSKIKLTGPKWHADYPVVHPGEFDMGDLARRSEDLNWRILEGGEELWRPEATSIGKAIYRALTSERRILEYLSVARALTGQGLDNLRLEFSGPTIGLSVPFELLRDEGEDYLIFKHVLSRRLTEYETQKPQHFYRFIENLRDNKQQPRILIVGVSADGLIPAAEDEAEELAEIMKESLQTLGFDPDIKLMVGASFNQVHQELIDEDYHIFHYAGHGSYNKEQPEISGLILPDEGGMRTLTAAHLSKLLGGAKNLRLVFLSCCLSARTARHKEYGDFYGMMDAVAKADIPIVLGYRWSLADVPAQFLAKEFYRTLWRTLLPGEALFEARRKTALEEFGSDDATWASPVLLVQTG